MTDFLLNKKIPTGNFDSYVKILWVRYFEYIGGFIMRNIEIYKGKEINEEKITKIKQIAANNYDIPIYLVSYHYIANIEQLAFLHGIDANDEILILGEDWFLCYAVSDKGVEFLEWVANDDTSSKFVQSIEMMNTFNSILFNNRNKIFIADMRHDTSYQFYSKMMSKGYFEELIHILDIYDCDGFEPETIKNLECNDSSIREFLNGDEVLNHPEYLHYILHSIYFQVTDTFSKRYSKLNRKL